MVETKRNYKKRSKEFYALLAAHKDVPCFDCGKKYPPYCMDFDHRDPSTKYMAISNMKTSSRARLEAEIAKCDIVCANCHRERTYGDEWVYV